MSEFYSAWMSQDVEVVSGSMQGWRGQVSAVAKPRVEVAFPKEEPRVERIWFFATHLKLTSSE